MGLLFDAGGPARPAPVARGPLPPFDTAGNPQTTLPANQIALPGPWASLWWRGNAFSVTIPGLPWLPGLTSSVNPERCLTWFLWHPLWADWVDTILTLHAERGYTHFTLSWVDARDFGLTIEQFVAICVRVRSWGFEVHVMFEAKDGPATDQTWDSYWATNIAPVLQALIAANAIQHACPGWEFDGWNIPGGPTQTIIDGFAAICGPADVKLWMHFNAGKTAWFADGSNRFAWWQDQVGKLDGLLYQCFPTAPWGVPEQGWDPGTMQARIADTTNRDANFIAGVFKFVVWENGAAKQFDDPAFDENQTDMIGWLALCSPGGCAVSGFGEGARLPDGTETLRA